MNEEFIQQEFSSLKDVNYFNTAYFGPSPLSAKVYVGKALEEELNSSFYPYERWLHYPEVIREKLAKLIKVSPQQIFHSTSVSEINALVGRGLNYSPEDHYVAIEGEFPSNVFPWLLLQEKKRIQVSLLPFSEIIDEDYLKKHLPAKCKIFNISHVSFNCGRKVDLRAIGKFLKERDIFFMVDGTQYLGGGTLGPSQLEFVDVYSCSLYKWMLGPYGSCFGYLSKNALKKLESYYGGWITRIESEKALTHYHPFKEEKIATHFDRGQSPTRLIMSCVEASLDFFQGVGMENVEAHNNKLQKHFLKNFNRKKFQLLVPDEVSAPLISAKFKGSLDSVELQNKLKKANIDVSVRDGNLRISLHLFNTLKQVDYLIEQLEK